MLRQAKLLLQRAAARRAVRPAGKPGEIQVRFCDGVRRLRRVLRLRACPPQRLEQHLRRHALHAELALPAGGTFAALLARNVGDIGVQHLLRRQCALEKIADDEARTVGVR